MESLKYVYKKCCHVGNFIGAEGSWFKLLLRHSNSIPMNQWSNCYFACKTFCWYLKTTPSVLPGGKTVGGWLPNGFLEVDAVRIWILLLIFLRGTCNTRSSKHAPLKKSRVFIFSSSRPTFSSFSRLHSKPMTPLRKKTTLSSPNRREHWFGFIFH